MNVDRNEPLCQHNTLALHARAKAFVRPTTVTELLEALECARAERWQVVPLGVGSNVIFAGDVQALVVQLATRGIEVLEVVGSEVTLRVAAGENWHEFVQWTLRQGYYGLENLALIPGTAGAAPIQNIGAYGVELQSVLLNVHAVQIADNKRIILDNAACQFGYRDSVFKRTLRDKLVITAVELRLSLTPNVNIQYPALASSFSEGQQVEPTPQAVFDAVVSIRQSKLPDPSVEPNAGSFFKNPMLLPDIVDTLIQKYPNLPCFPQTDGRIKVSAAWMIDQCGWKGHRKEGVGVHPEHALVLVNYGSNSGATLLALADEIAGSVYDVFGVSLEIEPRIYGLAA
jgi:UDP-N-acetylmuramate dehydrogenase